MKDKIIDFLKKHALKIGLIIIILILSLFNYISKVNLKNTTETLTSLQDSYTALVKQRDDLEKANSKLDSLNGVLHLQKQSLEASLKEKEDYLAYITNKHEKEIDSLMKVPADTIYKRLFAIYPNSNNDLLRFPFSQSQIVPIYSTALRLPRLQYEYDVQSGLLVTCKQLNKKHEEIEGNYLDQISNLKTQISVCDSQIGIKDEQLKVTQKQLKKKSFWNWIYKGTTIIFGTIAAVK